MLDIGCWMVDWELSHWSFVIRKFVIRSNLEQ